MCKIFFYEMNIPDNKRKLFKLKNNNDKKNNISDKSSLAKITSNDLHIHVYKYHSPDYHFGKGKTIEVLVMDKNKLIMKSYFGTLGTINDFYNFIRMILPQKKISKIKIEGKEIDKNDERTLSSFGIRDNFTCYVEFE